MRPWKDLFFAGLLGLVAITLANSGAGETKPVRVALVKMPYVGSGMFRTLRVGRTIWKKAAFDSCWNSKAFKCSQRLRWR